MTPSEPQPQIQQTQPQAAGQPTAEGQVQQTPQAREAAPGQEKAPGGKVVHLHTAHPRVPIPYVTPGDVFRTGRSATSMIPSPRKLAFYGLLGGMAATGAMAWPVAVAVGAATEVITREQRAERARHQREEHQAPRETTGRAEAEQPTAAAAR